jgi:hypothetical protein
MYLTTWWLNATGNLSLALVEHGEFFIFSYRFIWVLDVPTLRFLYDFVSFDGTAHN